MTDNTMTDTDDLKTHLLVAIDASASLDVHRDGTGELTGAVLHPVVTILEADRVEDAEAAHAEANRLCFVARSVAFPVHHSPVTKVRAAG